MTTKGGGKSARADNRAAARKAKNASAPLCPPEQGKCRSLASAAAFDETESEVSPCGFAQLKPEILAPAGDMPSALAGLAAGADALYLGLKHFSARMQAENFSTGDLADLADLAHAEGRRIYVAMNTLIKPNEAGQVLRLIRRLVLQVKPDALIVQDPAMFGMAEQAGFQGEFHLSTLANVTHPKALAAARAMGADRVILPRELSLPEVLRMNEACPQGLSLEIFVHGALCFCVSGRCWWSSYMGGKSALRGRCVQPCRRMYTQKSRTGRFFSCLDLSLDTLVHSLLPLIHLRSWKIEGRKKGPHYVYHLTTAYRMLRDDPANTEVHREAERLIGAALGRPLTRSLFVAGKEQSPTGPPFAKETQTSSGLLCARIGINKDKRYEIKPRLPLLARDYLRIGYEDEAWHCTLPVTVPVDKGASLTLCLPKNTYPKAGVPVFLIDRKDAKLASLLDVWRRGLRGRKKQEKKQEDLSALHPALPLPLGGAGGSKKLEVLLRSSLPHGREGKSGLKPGTVQGLWLSPKALRDLSKTLFSRVHWWLPPAIWPDEEEAWSRLIVTAQRGGACRFVCNSPWQTRFFSKNDALSLIAGPFCNIANALAADRLAGMGFDAAIVSPELGEEDMLSLPARSPLPLGLILDGFWPVGISRHRVSQLSTQEGFYSPKGESFWIRRYGQNTWIYPSWRLDLSARRAALERAGYSIFIHMEEHPPKLLPQARREGEFNWTTGVL